MHLCCPVAATEWGRIQNAKDPLIRLCVRTLSALPIEYSLVRDPHHLDNGGMLAAAGYRMPHHAEDHRYQANTLATIQNNATATTAATAAAAAPVLL